MSRQGRRRTGSPDLLDGVVEERDAREADELVIERLGRPDRVAVPLDDLAELQARQALAAPVDQAVKVPPHQVDTLLERRLGSGRAVLGPVGELAEDERVREGTAADRDRRATRFAERRG